MKTTLVFALLALLTTTVQAGNEPPQPNIGNAPLLAGNPGALVVKAARPAAAASPKWAASASLKTAIVGTNTTAVASTNASSATAKPSPSVERKSPYEWESMTTKELGDRGMVIGWKVKRKK